MVCEELSSQARYTDLRRHPGKEVELKVVSGSQTRHLKKAHRKPLLRRLEAPLFLAAIAAAFLSLGYSVINQAATSTPSTAQPGARVVVAPGDTLWSIARRYPTASMSQADRVQWIQSNNPAATTHLTPGQSLVLPASTNAAR